MWVYQQRGHIIGRSHDMLLLQTVTPCNSPNVLGKFEKKVTKGHSNLMEVFFYLLVLVFSICITQHVLMQWQRTIATNK